MVTDTKGLDELALKAAGEYVRRSSVCLIGPFSQDGEEIPIGSGTAIRTPGGRVVVLTAAHNFETGGERAIAYFGMPPGRALRGVASRLHVCDGIDVALFEVRGDGTRSLLPLSVDLDAIGAAEAVEPDFQYVVAGYPSGFIFTPEKHTHVLHAVANNVRGVGIDDQGRYRFRWDRAVLPREIVQALALPSAKLELPHPRGISGGALWRFQPMHEPVWSPTSHARLVAIPHRFLQPTQFAENVSRWGDWLRETIQRIDRDS